MKRKSRSSEFLSTSAAARLLDVAVGSVSKWIDNGQLKAGRTPGGHRRVLRKDLIKFLERQKLPIPKELLDSAVRVLVVDDEPSVTKWLVEELRAEHPDWEVFEAHDGFAAGELVAERRPQVVLLDLHMPGMDGFEVCRRILSKEETQNTAIIAITADSSAETERKILECGGRICIRKPLQLDGLLQEIRRALT